MPDDGGFFSDLGGGISDLASSVGGGISDAASWAGNQISNLFGSGSSSATPGALTSNPISYSATGAPTTSQGINFGNVSPGADSSSVAAFLNPTSAVSSPGYGGSGTNPDSILAGTGPGQPNAAPDQSGGSSKSIMQSLGLGNVNPIGAVAGAGGLAYNLIAGSPTSSAEKQLKSLAGSQAAQGQQLESYISNGTLPPGAQQWVNNQTAAQTAAIKAKYAQLGMSGSTAETQELNNVQAQATAQIFEIATQLLNTGVTETNTSATLYNYLMQAQNADQKDVSSAIQNFVSSLGGGGAKTISLNLGNS